MSSFTGAGGPVKKPIRPREPSMTGGGDVLERGAEAVLGNSDRTRAANEAVRALARTARSFTFYDATNDAVRNFIEELRACVARFHEGYGDLVLEIGPIEISVEGEPVYRDRDRERSLAGKLFRDGVRILTITAGATWDEITQLLVICSVRYVGLRMHEDDIVTLLWRAGLEHITVRAVDGFVSKDGESEGSDDGSGGSRGSADIIAASMAEHSGGSISEAGDAIRARITGASQLVPDDFDLPAPVLPPPVAVHFATLPIDVRAPLMMEVSENQLGSTTLMLVDELLAAVADPNDPIGLGHVVVLLGEVRDHVLDTDSIDTFVQLFERIHAATDATTEKSDAVKELLAGFGTVDAVARALDGVTRSLRAPPPGLAALIDAASEDGLGLLFTVLERERSNASRAIVRQLIERYIPEHLARVAERFEKSEGAVAADLLRTIANRAPEAAQQLVGKITAGEDIEVQTEFLLHLAALPMSTELRSYLSMLMRARALPVRLQALGSVLARGEKSALSMLVPFGEARAYANAPDEELLAIGETMAKLDPVRSLEQFNTWCRPPGWLARIMRRRPPMVRIAIGGLEWLDTVEAEVLLEVLEASGDPNVRASAEAASSNRRRRVMRDSEIAGETASPRTPASAAPLPEPTAAPSRAKTAAEPSKGVALARIVPMTVVARVSESGTVIERTPSAFPPDLRGDGETTATERGAERASATESTRPASLHRRVARPDPRADDETPSPPPVSLPPAAMPPVSLPPAAMPPVSFSPAAGMPRISLRPERPSRPDPRAEDDSLAAPRPVRRPSIPDPRAEDDSLASPRPVRRPSMPDPRVEDDGEPGEGGSR